METIIDKIKTIRDKKGYSHEYMGHHLDISQVAYSKIEKNETKLSVERLYKIAEILETSVASILDISPNNIYTQNNNNDNATVIVHQEVEHLYQDHKETNEKFIASLQDEIHFLRELLVSSKPS